MIQEFVGTPLEFTAEVIELLGIAILLIAAVKFLFDYVRFEIAGIRGMECVVQIRDIRLRLGSYILLALELMIVSDVIHTAMSRTLEDFLTLGILVAVRTVLSFFLSLDLKEAREA